MRCAARVGRRDSDRCTSQRPPISDDYFIKVLPSGRRRPPCRDTKQPREAYNLPQTAVESSRGAAQRRVFLAYATITRVQRLTVGQRDGSTSRAAADGGQLSV